MKIFQLFRSKKVKNKRPLITEHQNNVVAGVCTTGEKKNSNGQSVRIPGQSCLPGEQSDNLNARYTERMTTIRNKPHISQQKQRDIQSATQVGGLNNRGGHPLASTRRYYRRGALCECTMVEDIRMLRYNLLVENLKYVGLM